MAPLIGIVEITVGTAPVVKLHEKLAASGMPRRSVAPVVIVAVWRVVGARVVAGVNDAVVPV